METLVNLIRKQRKSVKEMDAQGATALHWAAAAGEVEVIDKLLEAGANVNFGAVPRAGKAASGLTASQQAGPALHWAAKGGSVEAIEWLVRQGADVRAVNGDGVCALHVAAGAGHVDAITKLMELGADFTQRNAWSQTPMRTAAISGSLECMLRLASFGSDWSEKQPDCAHGFGSPLDLYVAKHGGPRSAVEAQLKRARRKVREALECDEPEDVSPKAVLDALEQVSLEEGGAAVPRKKHSGNKSSRGSRGRKAGRGGRGAAASLQRSRDNCERQAALERAADVGDDEKVLELAQLGVEFNATGTLGLTALGRAAANGHVSTVKVLGSLGAEVARQDAEGVTAMHWAAGCGQVAVLGALVELGSDVNMVDQKGLSPLDRAAGKGEVLAVRELVRLGALPNAQDGAGATAMHWAADNGQAEAIAALVELGAVVGAVDAQGIAPLHRATAGAHLDAIRKLVELGADLDVLDADGLDVLDWAAERGDTEVVQLLVDLGAKIKNEHQTKAASSLHWAAGGGHVDALNLLMRLGAEVDAVDRNGLRPIHWAAGTADGRTVEALCAHGARVFDADTFHSKEAVSAIRLAVNHNNPATLRALARQPNLLGAASMAAEAEKEGENKAGVSEGTGVWAVGDGAALARRLVQCAAELGHVEVIRELATLGADVAGCATALHAAAVFGHSSALSALIDLGACVHTADDLGMSALHVAAAQGHVQSVAVLLDRGASAEGVDSNGNNPMQAAAMAGHLPVMLHLAGAGVSWACHPSPLEMYLNRQNNTQHLGAQHQQQMHLLETRLRRAQRSGSGRAQSSSQHVQEACPETASTISHTTSKTPSTSTEPVPGRDAAEAERQRRAALKYLLEAEATTPGHQACPVAHPARVAHTSRESCQTSKSNQATTSLEPGGGSEYKISAPSNRRPVHIDNASSSEADACLHNAVASGDVARIVAALALHSNDSSASEAALSAARTSRDRLKRKHKKQLQKACSLGALHSVSPTVPDQPNNPAVVKLMHVLRRRNGETHFDGS